MGINLGNQQIQAIYKGNNYITSVYKGSELVYSSNSNDIPIDNNQAQYLETFFNEGHTLDITRPIEIYLHLSSEALNQGDRFYFNGTRNSGIVTNGYRISIGLGMAGVFFERNAISNNLSKLINNQKQPCYLKANYNPENMHWTFELLNQEGVSQGTYTETTTPIESDTKASSTSTDYQINVGSVEVIYIRYTD